MFSFLLHDTILQHSMTITQVGSHGRRLYIPTVTKCFPRPTRCAGPPISVLISPSPHSGKDSPECRFTDVEEEVSLWSHHTAAFAVCHATAAGITAPKHSPLGTHLPTASAPPPRSSHTACQPRSWTPGGPTAKALCPFYYPYGQ